MTHITGSWWQMRWARGFGPEFDEALREWTLMMGEAVTADDPTGALWPGGGAPQIQWSADKRVNASATIGPGGRPLIRSTLGLYFGIHDFAYRLFSVSDLVQSIGVSGREGGSLAERARDRSWVRKPNEPVCPLRQQAAFLLAECAIAFVFYHEAGHLILGHCGDAKRPDRLEERAVFFRKRKRGLEPTAPEIRRAQLEEMQADRYALAKQFHHLRRSEGVFPGQIVAAEVAADLPKIVGLSQVASHIALNRQLLAVADFDERTHPHPLTRFVDSIGSFERGRMITAGDSFAYLGDAFRLSAAMLGEDLTGARFAEMTQDARRQHDAIQASAQDQQHHRGDEQSNF